MKYLTTILSLCGLNNAAFTMIPGQTCGISDSGLRVVGGIDATDSTQFPWQAKFRPCFQGRILSCSLCGATLISELWLVSAAHCTEALASIAISVGDSKVTVGGIQGGINSEGGIQERSLAAIEDHPEYVAGNAAAGHDITLLKVASAIVFSDKVHPACLPRMDDCFAEGSESWISGFGAVEYEGNIAATQQFAMVPIYNINQCQQAYGNFDVFTQVCAGFSEGGVDACQGDSGGPLAVSYQDVWYLYGVTSYGSGCASAGFPGVYARVTNYVSFILNMTSTDITADYAIVGSCPCFCQDGAGESQVADTGVTPGQSTGNFLNQQSLPCDTNPCQNGGTCSETQDFLSYTCTCAHEFTGTNCDQTQAPGTADEEYSFHFDNSNINATLEFLLGDNNQVLRETTSYVFFYYRLSSINFLINGVNRKKRSAEDVLNAIKDYGCWCPRALEGEGFGHAGVPLDDVDMFCKKWSQCNHCISMNGCGAESTEFTINFNPAADSYTCTAANQCAQDLCTCNGEFATSVARYLSDNGQILDSNFVNVDEASCEHNRSNGRKDACCGSSPSWVPYNSGLYQCDAGVLTSI